LSTSNLTPTPPPHASASPKAWWAASGKRARFAALGATALVLALLATSVFVWVSPQNAVKDAILAQVGPTEQDKIVKDRNSLLSQIIELKTQLADSKNQLSASQADNASIQQALWSAQGELDAIDEARSTAKPTPSNPAPAGPTITTTPSTPDKTTSKPTTVSRITAPTLAALRNPKSSLFGMYTEQAPFNFATFDSTAKKVGYSPDVVGYFGGWDEDFRTSAVTNAWKRDTMPILTWESRPIASGNDRVEEPDYELPDIIGDKANGISGTYDNYLRKYARSIVKTGLPLGIRLDHEMNGIWYPWSETTGAGKPINNNRVGDYVKMWRHVHDIFQEEGANELVLWIWSPNITNNLPASHKTTEFLDALYPGDDYVDWVGLSGYLRPAYKSDNDFSFGYTFDRSLDQLREITNKPIFLAEVGASETGGHKPAWVKSFFEGLAESENSDIIGFSWFNLAITSYVEGQRATNDWRIDSRKDTLEAFTAGLATPAAGFSLRKSN